MPKTGLDAPASRSQFVGWYAPCSYMGSSAPDAQPTATTPVSALGRFSLAGLSTLASLAIHHPPKFLVEGPPMTPSKFMAARFVCILFAGSALGGCAADATLDGQPGDSLVASAEDDLVQQQIVSLQFQHSNMFLQVEMASTDPRANLRQGQLIAGAPFQQWRLLRGAVPGNFLLQNRKSGLCVDVKGPPSQSGSGLWQIRCDARDPDQQWRFSTGVSGTTIFRPAPGPRLCLTVEGASVLQGGLVVTAVCDGRLNQKFNVLNGP